MGKVQISIIALLTTALLLFVFAYFSSGFPEKYEKYENYNKIITPEKIEEPTNLDFVSSTEYVLPRDHNGSTIVKLRDNKNDFINTSCYLTIVNPDRSIYLSSTLMSIDFTYGVYYRHWEVPEALGVFDQEVMCEVKGKNITQGKGFHVSNMTNILLRATESLNQSLQSILNALNCSSSNNSVLCAYLQSINNTLLSLTNISLNQGNSTLLISINSTLSDFTKIYYQISAPNCYVGSEWIFQANVTNEEAEALPFLNCILNTTRFGLQNILYTKELNRYSITNNCTSPDGVVDWDFNCERA